MRQLIADNQEPERLDTVLARLLKISRAKAQALIKADYVTVNGKLANSHLLVKIDDSISLASDSLDPFDSSDSPRRQMTPMPLNIIYEDNDVLVVNKPAGQLTHAAPNTDEPTLVDALLAHYPAIESVGDNKKRSGIVHRLDRDASGVIIVAKTQPAFEHLKNEFKERRTRKVYSVLVHGMMPKEHDTIKMPIARSKSKSGRMAARPAGAEGREAITHYDVVRRYPHLTQLDVVIETGRTHQIRAHMFAQGHGVVGDTLYHQKNVKNYPLGRLFLHARELTITLPSGETKTFTAPLPDDLKAFLK